MKEEEDRTPFQGRENGMAAARLTRFHLLGQYNNV
jgi:hypothetical protein